MHILCNFYNIFITYHLLMYTFGTFFLSGDFDVDRVHAHSLQLLAGLSRRSRRRSRW